MSSPGLHVLRDESETGWWQMTSRSPVASLRGLVRRYAGYREDSRIPVRRREVPTGDVWVIVSFGPRIDVVDSSGPGGVRHSLTSFIVPVDDSWAVTEYTGEQYGLEITLTPLGANRLLGLPMELLRDQVVDLEGVLGAEGRLLVERLADAPDWSARFDLLDQLLPVLAGRHRVPSPAAAWAWGRLSETEGRIPVATLVQELGCSHRYLLSEFRRHVGVPPKTLARVLRCQHSIRLLRHQRSLSEIASACGYSDQSHLNRDFRRLTGLTPTLFGRDDQGQIFPSP